MGTQQNVVVINGKHYDARTGKLLQNQQASHPQPKQTAAGQVMDGFTRRPSARTPKPHHPATTVHSKTERSNTLMRSAVKKPTSKKIHSKTHVAHHHSSPHPQQVHKSKPGEKHTAIPEGRIIRAGSVQKSQHISKFNHTNKLQKRVEHAVVPVTPEPSQLTHINDMPLKHANNETANRFQDAVEKATSHHQPHLKKAKLHQRAAKRLHLKPHTLNMAMFGFGILLLGGFFAYQNVSNLAVKVAAARAGVNAQLPSYRPSGFSMNGPIQYSPGKITINFQSNTDGNRSFSVTQRNSEWNSETLLENFVATDRRPYQTYQDKGKTIYIYDGSNATWIDSGVWYQIEGQSSLNSDQLIRIANSL